jgi:hypothetical protein
LGSTVQVMVNHELLFLPTQNCLEPTKIYVSD